MNKPVVVIGIGEIGSVFSRAFLRLGYPVVPVTRDMDMAVVAADVTEPELVVVAVANTAMPVAPEVAPVTVEEAVRVPTTDE